MVVIQLGLVKLAEPTVELGQFSFLTFDLPPQLLLLDTEPIGCCHLFIAD